MFQEMPVMSSGGGGMTPTVDTFSISGTSGSQNGVEPNSVISIGDYYFYCLYYIENGSLNLAQKGTGEYATITYDANTKTIAWSKTDSRTTSLKVINYT